MRIGQRTGGGGRRRRRSRRVEGPLKEMDVRTGVGVICAVLFLGLVAWQGQDKLWVLTSGGDDALVGFDGDDGADGVGVSGVAETPDGFDFLGREAAHFLDVDK